MTRLPDLIIGDLKIYPPIIQGGMGIKVSLHRLASAVANTGAVGTISAAIKGSVIVRGRHSREEYDSEDVRELTAFIREAKKLTKGVIAVNIMVALTNYHALVNTAIKEETDIIFSGAGLPMSLPELVKGSKVKIVPIISSGRAAEIICKNWIRKFSYVPDAIVLEGPLAGGHLGFSFKELEGPASMPRLEDIVLDVLKVAEKYGSESGRKIPVIAAGGIYTGKDIADMFKLGVSGVQLATRFVCTDECDADDRFKQAYIDLKKEDIIIIKSPVGMPGRAIRNEFLEKAARGEIKFKCDYQCLRTCIPSRSPYCIADALTFAAQGDFDRGFVFVGSNAYRCDKIVPVKELISELVEEAERNL